MKKFFKNKNFISIIFAIVLSFAFVALAAYATTIGTDIDTGGTLTVTGASSFTGLATLLGGATTTSLTLLNGEIISNVTNGVIQLGGIASTTSLTLLNGETITNATDGTIALTGNATVSGTLAVSATSTLELGLTLDKPVACVNFYATSTETRGSLVFVTTGATSTYAGTVYWQYGACN